MFYFQPLLNQVLAGIDGTSIISVVTSIAFAILLIGFLTGLYQAAMRGGDVQALGVTAIKYLVVGIIIANWSTAFREVNSAFNSVAQLIGNSSGAGDMFASWLDQLKQQFATTGNQSLLDMVMSTPAALINTLLILVAYVLYPLMVMLFSFFYVMYGSLLYVIGPLALALLPIAGVGQLARTFATNLLIWNAWAILYATFGALITAIHVNDVQTLLNAQGFLGWARGLPDSLLLGLVSIFYAFALALIPFIAKRIVSGDVGSTASSLVRAGALALGTAVAGASGVAAGMEAGGGTGSASSAGSGAGAGGRATGTAATSSAPPPVPAQVPSMANSIRSGIASAMSGSSSPATPPAVPTGNGGNAGGASPASAGGRNGGGSAGGAGFRGRGTAQTLAYQAGRSIGRSIRGKE